MKYRLVSDRIMKNGLEIQYKNNWWPMWLYLKPINKRHVYYSCSEALSALEFLNEC